MFLWVYRFDQAGYMSQVSPWALYSILYPLDILTLYPLLGLTLSFVQYLHFSTDLFSSQRISSHRSHLELCTVSSLLNGSLLFSTDLFSQVSPWASYSIFISSTHSWATTWYDAYDITLWRLWYNPMCVYYMTLCVSMIWPYDVFHITLWRLWYNPMTSLI
jgi:hypothetical protein